MSSEQRSPETAPSQGDDRDRDDRFAAVRAADDTGLINNEQEITEAESTSGLERDLIDDVAKPAR